MLVRLAAGHKTFLFCAEATHTILIIKRKIETASATAWRNGETVRDIINFGHFHLIHSLYCFIETDSGEDAVCGVGATTKNI